MTSQGSYEFRPLDLSPTGIGEIAKLLRQVWPGASHLDAAHLEWAYTRNPAGPALGCNAYVGPELVAHYAMQPLVAVFRGIEERGLLALNTATHPDHRGRGLHPELARRTYDAAAEAGFGFVTGAANQYSTRGYVEKLDFRFVRALQARFGLAPLPRARRSSEVEFARIWDAPSLAWRLLPPRQPYSQVERGDQGVVYAPTGRFLSSVEIGTFDRQLLPPSLPAFRRMSPLRLWIGFDPDRRWWPSLTIDLPVRWRPAPLNWLFLDLKRAGRVPRSNSVRVSAVDFDAY